MLGRALMFEGQYETGIIHLEKSVELDNDLSWISSWSYIYLGSYFSKIGELHKAKEYYYKTIKLNKTKNSVLLAKKH